MPTYMDIHDIPGVTAEAVAGMLPEVFLFIGQGVDPSEHVVVEHEPLPLPS